VKINVLLFSFYFLAIAKSWRKSNFSPLTSIRKNAGDISSERYAAHPVGYSPLHNIMAGWQIFLKFNPAGLGMAALCGLYYNGCGCFARFK
jgi:hypothetical protein